MAPLHDGMNEEDMAVTATGEIKVVGKSGQISLGKRYAGKTLELQRLDDGTLLLRAVAMIPESQLWTLQEPDRSRIAKGLAWAAETQPRETNPESLLKDKGQRRSRPRGRRE
jgi:hypothetical protein